MTTAANVQATVLRLDLYVAAGIGSDANPGTSSGLPFATLAAAVRRLKYWNVILRAPTPSDPSVIIHVGSGTYQWTETLSELLMAGSVYIYGDGAGQPGDDGFTVLASGTAQAGSLIGLLVTTGGFTINQHRGKTIQMTSGAANGDRRTIRNNTATDFVPAGNFTGAVVAGDTYRIVEPNVVIEFELITVATMGANDITPLARNCAQGTQVPMVNQSVQTAVPGGPIFANVRLKTRTGDADTLGAISIFNSNVCFYGVEIFADTSKFFRVSADASSSIYAGHDFNGSTTLAQALRPFTEGLVPTRTSWSGWGMVGMGPGTIAFRGLTKFRGYVALNTVLAIHHCDWQILGGSVIVTASNAMQILENSFMICGNNSSAPVVLVRCETNVADTATIFVGSGGELELYNTTVEKQDQGFCLAAQALGGGNGSMPGNIGINSTVTLTGITVATAPNNAIKCLGGRVDMRTTSLVISGFATGTQLAVYQGAGAGILVQQSDLADLIAGSALPCVPDRIFFLANGLLTGFVNAAAPGTFDSAAMVDGLREISRFSLIDTIRMTQVVDGGAGTTTMEIFRRRAAVNTSLGTVSIVQGGGVFASATLTPASVALRTLLVGDTLVAQFTARQTTTAANVTLEILGAGIDGRFGWIRRL